MGKRTIEVRGLTIHVDTAVFEDWATVDALKKIANNNDDNVNLMQNLRTLQAEFDFIETVTDVSEEDIVQACGGKSAKAKDVMATMNEIIQQLAPKN